MLRIRLQRLGRRNRPFYRIGAIDSRTRREGAMVERLGWYDPVARDPAKQVNLNGERIQFWLSKGAVPSDTVRDLLARADLLPAKMKAEWEADRKADRARVEKRKADAAAAAAAATEEKKES